MRLLVVTQVIDTEDPVLGFFHEWVRVFAPQYESIQVICLKKGKYDLPKNVTVYSLGKEEGVSKYTYVVRFVSYIWKHRTEYDAVFVHMNQEYILLAGWFWNLLKKPVYLWRNHYQGSWLTDLAASFCTKVFCTSKHSHTAKYAKTVLMPVGVDIKSSTAKEIQRISKSILFLARIAPSKRPDMLVEALGILKGRDVHFSASVYGAPLPEHVAYYESIQHRAQELGLTGLVTFLGAVRHEEVAGIYAANEIFVNLSNSGMYDKTLFEAAAQGCAVLACSRDFAELSGTPAVAPTAQDVANRLEHMLLKPEPPAFDIQKHSLENLAKAVFNEVNI